MTKKLLLLICFLIALSNFLRAQNYEEDWNLNYEITDSKTFIIDYGKEDFTIWIPYTKENALIRIHYNYLLRSYWIAVGVKKNYYTTISLKYFFEKDIGRGF
jgi:hypothetical protein